MISHPNYNVVVIKLSYPKMIVEDTFDISKPLIVLWIDKITTIHQVKLSMMTIEHHPQTTLTSTLMTL